MRNKGLDRCGFLWETMHLTLVIAIMATVQFFQKVDSCGFANDRFSFAKLICVLNDHSSEPLHKKILHCFTLPCEVFCGFLSFLSHGS
jgi:hypothetical protein